MVGGSFFYPIIVILMLFLTKQMLVFTVPHLIVNY